MNRIDRHFAQARQDGRKSLVLFLTAGFPSLAATEDLIRTVAESGADVLEIGVPFSDPLADGPTIQAASDAALRAGATLEKILDLVESVRSGSQIPILLFGAFNPFLHYGLTRLADRAAQAGVDGFLVPDLPCEESGEFEAICRGAGLSLIYLVAPTTPPERAEMVAARSTGFLYYISTKGVTGSTIAIDPELERHVAMVRSHCPAELPLAIGFGVRTPEHVAALAPHCDAVIVGSALIRLIDQHQDQPDLLDRVGQYVRSLKAAL